MTMEDLLGKISFIKRLYEVARIVDPIKNQVLDYQNDSLVPLPSKCYDVWERNQMCENCISRNALKDDETYAKIEFMNNHVYMVLAMPIHLKGEKVILELLRDITKERVLFDSSEESKSDAYNLLKDRNVNIIKDGLTNIFNNRYMNERLPYDIINSYIKEQYLSIFIIDIDNFKEINNKYSHQCGNKILIEFAKILEEKAVKNNAWVARYTADTFIVVLPNHLPKEASCWAEDFRSTVEHYDFLYSGVKPITITTSIVFYTKEKVDESMEQFIAKAKISLDQAKAQGKNCIVSNENVDIR